MDMSNYVCIIEVDLTCAKGRFRFINSYMWKTVYYYHSKY